MNHTDAPLLRLRGIHHRFGMTDVLRQVDLDLAAGETLVIKTSSGEELLSYTTEKNSASLLFSSEDLKQGETYGVYSEGNELSEVSMTSLVTTIGTSGMTPGGGNNPEGGKIPGGRP